MNFASLMKAQISKQKPTEVKSVKPDDKYLRRSEVEQQREAKYLAEQADRERERQDKADRKRKLDEDEADRDRAREEKKRKLAEESKVRRRTEEKEEERRRRKKLGLPPLPDSGDEDGDDVEGEMLEDEEVKSRLGDLNEPEEVEGEDVETRLKRYWKLTAPARSKRKAISKPLRTYPGPIPTTLEPLPGGDLIVPAKPPSDTAGKEYLYRQLASYFTLLLTEWATALSNREAHVKASTTGKAATQTMNLAVDGLRPLLRKLETSTIEPDILKPLVEIIHAIQQRRYVDANDAYLRLSIGKAAWPIGVTMVGIHERSAREKLHSGSGDGDKTAHIMQDEGTRKYLQAVKRCLSFAQTRWPPEDLRQLMG